MVSEVIISFIHHISPETESRPRHSFLQLFQLQNKIRRGIRICWYIQNLTPTIRMLHVTQAAEQTMLPATLQQEFGSETCVLNNCLWNRKLPYPQTRHDSNDMNGPMIWVFQEAIRKLFDALLFWMQFLWEQSVIEYFWSKGIRWRRREAARRKHQLLVHFSFITSNVEHVWVNSFQLFKKLSDLLEL